MTIQYDDTENYEDDTYEYDLSKGNYNMLGGTNDTLPRWQLTMADELESFKRSMLGVVKNNNISNENPHKFVRIMGAESVNETGAIAIYNKFMSYLTKLTSDTKLDEDTIKKEVLYADDTFTEWLARNSLRFELSRKDYRIIVEQFSVMLKLAMYRSYGGWKGDLINMHPTTREVVYKDREESNKGSVGMLPFSMFGGK